MLSWNQHSGIVVNSHLDLTFEKFFPASKWCHHYPTTSDRSPSPRISEASVSKAEKFYRKSQLWTDRMQFFWSRNLPQIWFDHEFHLDSSSPMGFFLLSSCHLFQIARLLRNLMCRKLSRSVLWGLRVETGRYLKCVFFLFCFVVSCCKNHFESSIIKWRTPSHNELTDFWDRLEEPIATWVNKMAMLGRQNLPRLASLQVSLQLSTFNFSG